LSDLGEEFLLYHHFANDHFSVFIQFVGDETPLSFKVRVPLKNGFQTLLEGPIVSIRQTPQSHMWLSTSISNIEESSSGFALTINQ
jgi:hypothetical protein